MKYVHVLFIAACLLFLLTAPAAAALHTINQVGTAFVPDEITINPGDTVEWVWSSSFHTVTSGLDGADPNAGIMFDESLSQASPTFSYTFIDEGVFPFFCRPHVAFGMDGLIHVVNNVATRPSTWRSVKALYR